MILYMARHGQTSWNVENKVLGRTDIPLNEAGRQQAYELAARLKDTRIDFIFTSPLSRAVETAQIVAQSQESTAIFRSDALIEQDFGVFEGVLRSNDVYQAEKRKLTRRYPEGESFFDVAARVYPFIRHIAAAYPQGSVLFVTHNGICRVASTFFQDMDTEAFVTFQMGNCEVRRYDVRNAVADNRIIPDPDQIGPDLPLIQTPAPASEHNTDLDHQNLDRPCLCGESIPDQPASYRKSAPAYPAFHSSDASSQEYLELLTPSGDFTGQKELRSMMHRNGDWHSSIHLWFYDTDTGRYLLGKRSFSKDAFPGRLDVAAAGHVTFGEQPLQAAIRETAEEEYIHLRPENIRFVCRRQLSITHPERNFISNEWNYVYLYADAFETKHIRPIPDYGEITELQWFSPSKIHQLYTLHPEQICIPQEEWEIVHRWSPFNKPCES